jgi:hypothetical protein
MTDPGGGPSNERPPDLLEPPAYIEGAGGGPAFPVGSLSADEKAAYTDLAGIANMTAIVSMSGAIILSTSVLGSAFLFGVAFGAIGVSMVAITLAEDPPQPNYARPVEFRQRVSNPLPTTDPALEPLRVVIQQNVFATVTARGYLDAIERLQGAQQANDYTWALMQRGVADLARDQLIIDLANNGAALYAAGNALKGNQFDVALEPGMSGVKQWIEDKKNQATLAPQLEASGFTREEMKHAIAYFKSDPVYNGPSSTLSAQLTEFGEKIHATAMTLDDLK